MHNRCLYIYEINIPGFSSTEELQKQLVEQVELRKKLEREFQSLKGNFLYVGIFCIFIFYFYEQVVFS